MLGRRLLVAVLLLNALLAPLSAPARASDIDAGPGFRRDELTASDVEAGLRGQRLRGLIAAQSRDAIDAALHPFTVPDGPANCVVQRCVALTFDDGPSANSEHLLDVLAGLEVKATFFVIGRSIGGRSATLQRMQREGHEIGNHTWDHPRLSQATPEEIARQVALADAAITRAVGASTTLRPVRPPYAALSDAARRAIGRPVVMWSLDSLDWKDRDPAHIAARMRVAWPGAIILCHDTNASTADALPEVVEALREKGYRFVTISELYAPQGLVPGGTYTGKRGTEAKIP